MITRQLLLACYPDRDFFISRAGQNWQLLVPAASRSQCGYIDECLYTIYEHTDSHSRRQRTVDEMYQRWEMFTGILRRALKVSRCNYEKSLKLIEENNACQQFYYAVSHGTQRVETYDEGAENIGSQHEKKVCCTKCMLGVNQLSMEEKMYSLYTVSISGLKKLKKGVAEPETAVKLLRFDRLCEWFYNIPVRRGMRSIRQKVWLEPKAA